MTEGFLFSVSFKLPVSGDSNEIRSEVTESIEVPPVSRRAHSYRGKECFGKMLMAI